MKKIANVKPSTLREIVERIKGVKKVDIDTMEDLKTLNSLKNDIEGLDKQDLRKSEIKQFTNKLTYINNRIDELNNKDIEQGTLEIMSILENTEGTNKDTKKVASKKAGIKAEESKKTTKNDKKEDKKVDKKVVDIKDTKELKEYNKLSDELEPIYKLKTKDMEKMEIEDLHSAISKVNQLIVNTHTPIKRKKDLEKLLKALVTSVKRLEESKPESEVVVDAITHSTIDLLTMPNLAPTEKIYITLETEETLQLCYIDDNIALLSDKEGAIQCSSSKLRKGFVVYSIGKNNYAFEVINSFIA